VQRPQIDQPSRGQPGALACAALCAAFLGLYLACLCPNVYWSDSAEYATAAYTRGVPHPPGYPLYTLLAHGFVQLPLSPAHAVNLLSALCAVTALGLCFALARTLGASPGAAAGGAALLGSGATYWHNASVAEVYAPGLCFTLAVMLLLVRAVRAASPRMAIAAASLAGAGLGVHYSIATCGLGFAWLAFTVGFAGRVPALPAQLRLRRAAALLLGCAAATFGAFAAVCLYFALADPDGAPNFASPLTPARLLWLLSGGNYRLWFLQDYAFGERVRQVGGLIAAEVSLVGLVCAPLGLLGLFARARAEALALVLALAGNVAFFFRYRVEDLEVFFLPAAALLCVAAALAPQALALRTSGRARALLGRCLPLLLLGFAATRVVFGYPQRDLHDYTAAQDYGERLANALPRQAVILNYTTPAEWRYDAVFGLYFQHVLGRRSDVIVVKNADRPVIDRLLAEQRPVFLYARVEHVAGEYALVPDGEIYRLIARR
jgi:hypothetical protein